MFGEKSAGFVGFVGLAKNDLLLKEGQPDPSGARRRCGWMGRWCGRKPMEEKQQREDQQTPQAQKQRK